MTQEELDALMAGDLDLDAEEESDGSTSGEESSMAEGEPTEEMEEEEEVVTPPPATKEHRVVRQLDDVTRDSEEKASEIFDALDAVMNDIDTSLGALEKAGAIIENFDQLFTTLREKFPHIQRFEKAQEETEALKNHLTEVTDTLQNANDQILGAMDTMQYQDIHRQKIERVINIMRALSRYMSALFEGSIEDEKRVKSAKHIEGDTHIDEVISNDDIEALIAQFGGK